MILMHGIFEWAVALIFLVGALACERLVPFRRVRYGVYALALLTAFIFDLNEVSFRSTLHNALWYALLLFMMCEILWICVRKNSKPLTCAAIVILPPILLVLYVAFLSAAPFICHDDAHELISEYRDCGGMTYTLVKRNSFDPFDAAPVYTLYRDLRNTPFKRRVDRYSTKVRYYETKFGIQWECRGGGSEGAMVHLVAHYETIWSLWDKNKVRD